VKRSAVLAAVAFFVSVPVAVASPPVAATATVTPRVVLFGGVAQAELRIAVDPRRVDARTISVTPRLAPFTVVGRASRRVESSLVVITYRIQCLVERCSHPAAQALVALRPATIRWKGGRTSVAWQPAAVASRLTQLDLQQPSLHFSTAASSPHERVDPRVLAWACVGGSAALALAAAATAILRLRRPVRRLDEESASPLEQALERLERAAEESQTERRAALDDLAQVLEHEGFPELAPLARRLAWSSGGPSPETAFELALLVRAAAEVAR